MFGPDQTPNTDLVSVFDRLTSICCKVKMPASSARSIFFNNEDAPAKEKEAANKFAGSLQSRHRTRRRTSYRRTVAEDFATAFAMVRAKAERAKLRKRH